MNFFTPELQAPDSIWELLVTPGLFAFFGVFMYIGAVRFEESYGAQAKWWKWCFAPLALAVLMGLQRVVFLQDLVYANTVVTRKLRIGHYLTFILPLVSVAAILLHNKFRSREQSLYKNAS